jgi:hypothetical protein
VDLRESKTKMRYAYTVGPYYTEAVNVDGKVERAVKRPLSLPSERGTLGSGHAT